MRLCFLPFTSSTLRQLPSKLLRLASRVRLSRLRGVSRLQQRSLSRAALQAQLVQHYIKQGDSAEESHDLATAELRWLAQAAREQASSAKAEEERLTSMVRELMEEDKPLAYILGE